MKQIRFEIDKYKSKNEASESILFWNICILGLWDYVPHLPNHVQACHLYIFCRICYYILILAKYFVWASGAAVWGWVCMCVCLGGGGSYLYRTFLVFYMFDRKTKMLETKFRSNLILTEKMNHNLINRRNLSLWFFLGLNFEAVDAVTCRKWPRSL